MISGVAEMELRWSAAARRAGSVVTMALCCGGAGSPTSSAADLEALMTALSRVREVRSSFHEQKELAGLTAPLASSGRLIYDAPARLEKRTTTPFEERLVVDHDWLTYTRPADGTLYTMSLDKAPELRGLVEAVRGTLAGDLDALRRYYEVTLAGSTADWRLTLIPVDARVDRVLASVRIDGRATDLRRVETVEANGDVSLMTIEPAVP